MAQEFDIKEELRIYIYEIFGVTPYPEEVERIMEIARQAITNPANVMYSDVD